MPQCLFCLREKEGLTDEHIFPAALGGVLALEGSTCTECNHGFSKFEQPLVAELASIRLLLQIPDRYGEVPQVAATVRVQDKEYAAKVKDGKVQLKRTVTEVVKGDGTREFVHRFLTERQREKLAREAKEKGIQLIEEGPGKPERGEVHIGGDRVYLKRGNGRGEKAVEKTAAPPPWKSLRDSHFPTAPTATGDDFAVAGKCREWYRVS